MPRYEITGPDGRTAIIEAPEGVSEQEAIGFAQENWAGWVDGGRYAMEPAMQAAAVQPELMAGTVPPMQERGLIGEAAAGAARGVTGTAAAAGEGALKLTPIGPLYEMAKRIKPGLSLADFVHGLNEYFMPRTREDVAGRMAGTAGEIAGGVLAGGGVAGSLSKAA